MKLCNTEAEAFACPQVEPETKKGLLLEIKLGRNVKYQDEVVDTVYLEIYLDETFMDHRKPKTPVDHTIYLHSDLKDSCIFLHNDDSNVCVGRNGAVGEICVDAMRSHIRLYCTGPASLSKSMAQQVPQMLPTLTLNCSLFDLKKRFMRSVLNLERKIGWDIKYLMGPMEDQTCKESEEKSTKCFK